MSPAMAAAAAIAGYLVDVREYMRDSTADSAGIDNRMRAEQAPEARLVT
jgi:hypothetical protein